MRSAILPDLGRVPAKLLQSLMNEGQLVSIMRVLSIGEVMIEMAGGGDDDTFRMGFAGDTLNTLWYIRAALDPARDRLGYFTALGQDDFSDRIVAFLHANGIETGAIPRLENRRPGLYVIEQKDGDRRFTYWRETSAARHLADQHDVLETAIERPIASTCPGSRSPSSPRPLGRASSLSAERPDGTARR